MNYTLNDIQYMASMSNAESITLHWEASGYGATSEHYHINILSTLITIILTYVVVILGLGILAILVFLWRAVPMLRSGKTVELILERTPQPTSKWKLWHKLWLLSVRVKDGNQL